MVMNVKGDHEYQYWMKRFQIEGGKLNNGWYKRLMMDAGDVKDVSFFEGKTIVDIGCGPRGSLEWLAELGIAKSVIGVDPLCGRYLDFGINNHKMLYLKSDAENIPFPDEYVDIVFSINSLDHTDDPVTVSNEIRRILKPGGYFIGSINLYEKPTPTEPHELTEVFLDKHLFPSWHKQFYKVRPKGKEETYQHFYSDLSMDNYTGPMILWCRYQKPYQEK